MVVVVVVVVAVVVVVVDFPSLQDKGRAPTAPEQEKLEQRHRAVLTLGFGGFRVRVGTVGGFDYSEPKLEHAAGCLGLRRPTTL